MHRSLNVVVTDSLGNQKIGFNSDAMIDRLRFSATKQEQYTVSGFLHVTVSLVEIHTESLWTKFWNRVARIGSRHSFPTDSQGLTFSPESRKEWLKARSLPDRK